MYELVGKRNNHSSSKNDEEEQEEGRASRDDKEFLVDFSSSGFQRMSTRDSSVFSTTGSSNYSPSRILQKLPLYNSCDRVWVCIACVFCFGIGLIVWSITTWITNNYGGCSNAPSCGTVLASYHSIPAYSNGKFQCSNKDCQSSSPTFTGRQYQCVEFVQRYLYTKYAIDPKEWQHDNADQMCDRRPSSVILTSTPKPGDLYVANSETPGHVAIISQVHWFSVDVVEQNASPTGKSTYYKHTAKCFLTVQLYSTTTATTAAVTATTTTTTAPATN